MRRHRSVGLGAHVLENEACARKALMQSASANHYLSPTFPSLLVEKELNPL